MPVPAPMLLMLEPAVAAPADVEETEVADPRGALSPSQQIELRLTHLRAAAPTFVSQMQRQLNRRTR
jgi:hypothetical protein